jgi:hypothetical protein
MNAKDGHGITPRRMRIVAMSTAVEPYTLSIPDAALTDLHTRIDATRWPEAETVDDWSQGVPLTILQDLVHTWRHDYD